MELVNDIKQFIKFGFVGVSNTLINWCVFLVLVNLGFYYISANVIAYLVATANSFLWNSKWVF